MGWPKVKRKRIEARVECGAHATLEELRSRLGLSWSRFFEAFADALDDDLKLDPSSLFALTVLPLTNSQDTGNIPASYRHLTGNMPASLGAPMRRRMRRKNTDSDQRIDPDLETNNQINPPNERNEMSGAESAVVPSVVPLGEVLFMWNQACDLWHGDEEARCVELAKERGHSVEAVMLEHIDGEGSPELRSLVALRWRETPDLAEWRKRFVHLVDALWVVRVQRWTTLEEILEGRTGKHPSIFSGLRRRKTYAPNHTSTPAKTFAKVKRSTPVEALAELERLRHAADSKPEERTKEHIAQAVVLLASLDDETREGVVDGLSWAFRASHDDFRITP